MNVMIRFECKCKESFRISTNNLIAKSSVICPNCDQEFPDFSLEKLKSIANALRDFDEELSQKIGISTFNYWTIKFEE